MQTLSWARDTFCTRVQPDRPDEGIPLALTALLVAVEDEAAAEIFYENNPPLLEQAVLQRVRSTGTKQEKVWEKHSGMSEAPVLGQVTYLNMSVLVQCSLVPRQAQRYQLSSR